MAVPSYSRIDNTEVDAESPITQSLMQRLKNNVLALLGVDELSTNPTIALGIRGEVFATDTSIIAVGIAVSGSAPGPYTLTVPTGISKMWLEIVGGGGGRDTTDGTASTVTGSTSGAIATANNGTGSTGGAASGRCFAGANGILARGGCSAGPHGPGNSADEYGGFGGKPGLWINSGSQTAGTGFGHGSWGGAASAVNGGGGAAGGAFVISVVPGETLTLTPGVAGGRGACRGFIRLRF